MAKRTPFYDLHVKTNAKIVDFSGWDMPLHYGSQLHEHHQVRQHAGMFDVSHMGVVDLHGHDAAAFLRRLLANNIDRLVDGKALYTCMLNEAGGVLDDLIVYKVSQDFYRMVINAGTREKDIAWMKTQGKSFKINLVERTDLAMLAIQGPAVKDKAEKIFTPDQVEEIRNLKPFTFVSFNDWFIARTGYTGEDGYEIIFPANGTNKLWEDCIAAGIAPCGLGARDTLRLEAGLNLYGLDMDETTTPLEANLAWTVMMDPSERNFIGREALEKQIQQGVKCRLVGLILDGPGVIRNHQKVIIAGNGEGEVTSGGYSPTLEKSIALARVPAEIGTHCFVEIRNKQIPAQVIKPPFVRNGKKVSDSR
ncbi:MAG: glycine cleavage system aminomethyltransferase GcvT [Gammaproteobacteria bacterium]|nr:glycine cleavage system aminomethyltransferase GcvT [Gammaproteobacteria bacterium]MCW5582357.1 glycine cleavage system aminomethyltransferase GcvT [Gammaproteobacteria bacterium]